MIKKLLLIGCFLSLFTSLNAQTLSAGDIAIIGVNFDTSPNYEITIVTLAPIVANTQIRISDYWYNESTPNTLTNVSAASGIALKAEGGILWQPTAAITPGTVFKIEITKGANTVTGLPGNVTVTGWTDPSPTASPGNPGGENWFIYQGSSITNVSNFIFLWGNGFPFNINSINITAGKFVTTGIGDLSLTTVTYLPPSLTLGTNAIALTTVTYHGDNNVYTGIRIGTKESILAEICNLNKWNHHETVPYNIDPGGTNFPGLNPIFTITTPPNTAPTDVALSATTINENVTGNSTIGSLTSTDANTGDTFTYTLVAGTGDTDNASFNINDSDLRITASPDFETKSSYSVRIRTTDQGGLTFEKVFTITVNNVNEAPTDVALSVNTINENVSANSAVGTLSSTDADASNTFTYTLVAGSGDTDNTAFTITGNSLTINASPDFETKSSYSVRIRTTDQGGLTFEKAFTITINNVNEAPTDIALSNTSINENVSANSAVGALSSTDPDSGNTFTYNLVAGAGSTDNASYSITGNSLTINASPDFETKSSYSVRIRTTDQGGLTFDKQFTITINNLAEGILLNSSPTLTFTSNSAAITGDDIASDGEGGSQTISDIDIQVYNISNSNGTLLSALSLQNNTFMASSSTSYTGLTNENNAGSKGMAIKSANGSEFRLNQFIYYNWGEASSFTNTVKGYRDGSEVASTTFDGFDSDYTPKTITLTSAFQNVDEVRFYITAGGYFNDQSATNHSINSIQVSSPVVASNTAPTNIALSATSINENVSANSAVGTLSSTDADASNTFTYTLVAGSGDTDNTAFTITGNSLTINASPDFETKSSYSVRIRTTDQGGLTFEKAFTITINNVNEAPTDIALSNTSINENVSANSAVGALSSTDPDSGNTFTYNLVAGAGSTDNASFSITGNSLTINASPDFETKSSYSVRIRTTDQGSLTFEKVFTITVNSANEAPTDVALSTSAINENVAANSTVGTLSSTDADASNTFTYTLVAGTGSTDNTAFTITGNSLTINASPDFETKSSYSVRIRTTDQGGLTFEKVFTITVNNLCDIVLTSASQTNIACNGGSTGAATVNAATGGTGPYTYNWTPGTPTGDGTTSVTGLTAGTWTCTVTDANGCNTTQNFTVTQTAAISTATAAQTNVSCNGGSNGSASVTPSGGAGGYTYSWSPSGGTAATATGLSAGTYTVTVTDANACTATRNFTITQPTTISTATAAQTNVSCNGGSNGSASVTPSGGAGGYTYSWSPSGGTAATATGLSAGTYTVTVTDANACTATRNFTITQPTTISTATAAQTNVSCNGGSNGSASVTPSGGAGGYTYSWSPSGGTAATATGLSAGTYTVTVTDANACTVTRNFTITQPMTISTATAAQTNVSCNGGSNGSASVTPSGGAGGYTYSWSPSGGTAATATGLSAGTYTVTVTDANACTVTRNFTITQPTAISTATAAQTNVSCNGDSNGSASVTPSGGAGGYTYSWSPSGGTAATATGLAAGTYTVTVTDANSCTATQNFTITEPMPIDFTTTILSGYDYNTGYSETIVTSRGTGTKTYAVTAGSLPSGFSLSSAGQITGISTQIADSNFTVTATDDNNCIATYNYVLKLNQIPITVTATPSQTKVYGESDPVLTYTVSPSLLPGDSFTGSLTRVSGKNIGNYAINQGSLSAGSKYLITFVGTNFTITAKPITVTATPSQTKVYGATDPIFDYTVSPSLVGSDAITGALTRVAGENIGTYTINQGSLSAGSNYTISYADANFTITAKPITVTATPSQTKVYGTTDPAFTYTVSPNLVGSDAFTGALTRVAGENIGNYAITQGNLSAGSNYTISYISKDFAITAKPIIVTADPSQTKEYGTANPVYSYTVSPSLVSGDSFTGTLTRAAGENIGNYAITQGSLSAGSNYTISYAGANFTITVKPITVTANTSQTKIYGTTDPVFAYTVSPSLVSGDSFTGTLTKAAGENVGIYAITQGTLSAGGNYTIMYNGSNFTITKADQVITWNQTLGLGCNGETSLVMTAVANSGLAVNYTSSNATIASVSNNSLLFQNYGSTTITASQAGNMNYNAAPTVVLPVVTSQPNLIRKQFENIIFFDNSSKSFKSYSWYKNGGLVPGQTSQYFKENGALNGTYYAVATKLDGTLITTCPLTLSPSVEEEYIRIVPNPVRSNANFQLITNVSSSKLQNARVELYNLTGSLLTTITNPNQNTIDMIAPNAGGIYIVKMTLANGKYFTKNLLVKN